MSWTAADLATFLAGIVVAVLVRALIDFWLDWPRNPKPTWRDPLNHCGNDCTVRRSL